MCYQINMDACYDFRSQKSSKSRNAAIFQFWLYRLKRYSVSCDSTAFLKQAGGNQRKITAPATQVKYLLHCPLRSAYFICMLNNNASAPWLQCPSYQPRLQTSCFELPSNRRVFEDPQSNDPWHLGEFKVNWQGL